MTSKAPFLLLAGDALLLLSNRKSCRPIAFEEEVIVGDPLPALAELDIDEAFAPDLAASATEAVADFSLHHDILIAGEQVPITLLLSSYPAVQEFNKWLMAYIIRFQKLRFEN